TFSPREREVLDLIVRGHTNGEIAEALGISFATAKWHVSELITKLGVASREEVADYWRHERAPRRRLSRALRALVAAPALKLASGGAIAGIAATGAVWVAVVANGSGGPRTAQVVDLTPTATSPATQPAVTLGQPAPQFSLPYARDPSRFVQLDDFLGQPLVLTWYASWCDACSDILRDLDELRGAYPQLAVLAISLEEPAATATAYLDGIPTLIDAALDERREVAWRYGVTGLPSTVLIDGSGVVQYLALGTAPTETLFGHFLRATGLVEPAVEAPRPDVCRETGSGPTREEAQAALLCHALNWPAIAAADAGNCDLRSLDLAPTGDEFGHLDHIDFRGCVLDGARLDRHTMNAASFAGVSAAGARMAFVQLNNGDLSGADLSHSDLVRAGLPWTNFTNANLLGADLTNAITRGATWNNTICPDGTNSDANGGTCVGTISVSDYWPASGPGGWV
ncbi:MAG: redoxin domain-containing protein, partial [Dehalococcoidia bacterium]